MADAVNNFVPVTNLVALPLATLGTLRTIEDVAVERLRQVTKWGVQSLPNGTSAGWYARHRAEEAKLRSDQHDRQGQLTWLDVLDEEHREALAEEDYAPLRAELIQVAAVALAWVEDLDRKALAAKEEFGRVRADATFSVVAIPDPNYPGKPS